jgi:hypothetical protein
MYIFNRKCKTIHLWYVILIFLAILYLYLYKYKKIDKIEIFTLKINRFNPQVRNIRSKY